MFYFVFFGLAASFYSLLNILLWWHEVPYEGVVALRGIYFFAVWVSVVAMSYSNAISNNPDYRRLFETNNIRWVWLAGFTLAYLVYCANTGWGQPFLWSIWYSAVDGVGLVQKTDAYREGESLAQALGKRAWNFLELDNYQKVLSSKNEISKQATVASRSFYGLVTWSHWMVFVLYLLATFFYGIASWRDELSAWVERRRHAREQRQVIQPQAPTAGTITLPGRPGWLLGIEGLIDVFAEIIGSAVGSRFFGGR